jgi:hypothetical protein
VAPAARRPASVRTAGQSTRSAWKACWWIRLRASVRYRSTSTVGPAGAVVAGAGCLDRPPSQARPAITTAPTSSSRSSLGDLSGWRSVGTVVLPSPCWSWSHSAAGVSAGGRLARRAVRPVPDLLLPLTSETTRTHGLLYAVGCSRGWPGRERRPWRPSKTRRKWIWRSCPGTSLIGPAYRPRWWRVSSRLRRSTWSSGGSRPGGAVTVPSTNPRASPAPTECPGPRSYLDQVVMVRVVGKYTPAPATVITHAWRVVWISRG